MKLGYFIGKELCKLSASEVYEAGRLVAMQTFGVVVYGQFAT